MIRISCVLTLALALSSCGVDPDQQGDTAGVSRFRFEINKGQVSISGSFENMPAKSVVDELLKRFRGDWRQESHSSSETSTFSVSVTMTDLSAPLRGYAVANTLADSPGKRFTFKFELKTLADLKELLERELKATVTLDEKAKTFTVE